MGEDLVTFTIGEDPPPRLDKALARDVPESAALSRSRLMRLIAEGAVRVGGRVETDGKARIGAGEMVEIVVGAAEESHLEAQAIALEVVYEDDDLIVIDKPAGMVVHPGPGNADGTLVNALIHHCGDSLSGVGGMKRPGIVHRIDKETSGLLVAAKTDRAHAGLAAQFAAHDVERHYLAVCTGVPDKGDPRLRGIAGVSFEAGGILRIEAALDRHRADRQKQAVTKSGGRHAVTRVRVEEVFGTPPVCALVDCWLETGRTHQIRVHLAHVGHGLVGDQVYGGRRKLSERALGPAAAAAMAFPRQALHAATLGFVHPVTGEEMRFESPLPADLTGLVQQLRVGA